MNSFLNNLRSKLLSSTLRFLGIKSSYDLNCEKLIKFLAELEKSIGIIVSNEEFSKIYQYIECLLDTNNTLEIDRICFLIYNSSNGIDRTLVESLIKLIPETNKQINYYEPYPIDSHNSTSIKQYLILLERQTITTQIPPVPPQENPHKHQENAIPNNSVPPLFPDNDDMCQIY